MAKEHPDVQGKWPLCSTLYGKSLPLKTTYLPFPFIFRATYLSFVWKFVLCS